MLGKRFGQGDCVYCELLHELDLFARDGNTESGELKLSDDVYFFTPEAVILYCVSVGGLCVPVEGGPTMAKRE
jgi:hypothetical protein